MHIFNIGECGHFYLIRVNVQRRVFFNRTMINKNEICLKFSLTVFYVNLCAI